MKTKVFKIKKKYGVKRILKYRLIMSKNYMFKMLSKNENKILNIPQKMSKLHPMLISLLDLDAVFWGHHKPPRVT